MIAGLADLVAPHDPARLLDALAGKRWLKLRTDQAAGFGKLVPWSAFNSWITLDGHARGVVRLLRAGRETPLELFSTRGADGRRRLLPDALQTLCSQGLSIQILETEQLGMRIAAVLASIERELRIDTSANAYASFARDGALPAHSDDHDVLVLQIDGAKRWTGYGRREVHPIGGGAAPAAATRDPDWEERLEPGDLLYLPRGEIHRADVEGGRSLHLTIGLRPAQGRDTLAWLMERSVAEQVFREDLPASEPPRRRATRQRRLREALHRLTDTLDLDVMNADKDRGRAPFRPINLGLADPAAPSSWVALSLRRRPALPATGGASFEAGGMTIALDPAETAVLAQLLERGGARVGDLIDGGSDREALLAALSRLARRSLIFVIESDVD